jgi:hypothetical protein
MHHGFSKTCRETCIEDSWTWMIGKGNRVRRYETDLINVSGRRPLAGSRNTTTKPRDQRFSQLWALPTLHVVISAVRVKGGGGGHVFPNSCPSSPPWLKMGQYIPPKRACSRTRQYGVMVQRFRI